MPLPLHRQTVPNLRPSRLATGFEGAKSSFVNREFRTCPGELRLNHPIESHPRAIVGNREHSRRIRHQECRNDVPGRARQVRLGLKLIRHADLPLQHEESRRSVLLRLQSGASGKEKRCTVNRVTLVGNNREAFERVGQRETDERCPGRTRVLVRAALKVVS